MIVAIEKFETSRDLKSAAKTALKLHALILFLISGDGKKFNFVDL